METNAQLKADEEEILSKDLDILNNEFQKIFKVFNRALLAKGTFKLLNLERDSGSTGDGVFVEFSIPNNTRYAFSAVSRNWLSEKGMNTAQFPELVIIVAEWNSCSNNSEKFNFDKVDKLHCFVDFDDLIKAQIFQEKTLQEVLPEAHILV